MSLLDDTSWAWESRPFLLFLLCAFIAGVVLIALTCGTFHTLPQSLP